MVVVVVEAEVAGGVVVPMVAIVVSARCVVATLARSSVICGRVTLDEGADDVTGGAGAGDRRTTSWAAAHPEKPPARRRATTTGDLGDDLTRWSPANRLMVPSRHSLRCRRQFCLPTNGAGMVAGGRDSRVCHRRACSAIHRRAVLMPPAPWPTLRRTTHPPTCTSRHVGVDPAGPGRRRSPNGASAPAGCARPCGGQSGFVCVAARVAACSVQASPFQNRRSKRPVGSGYQSAAAEAVREVLVDISRRTTLVVHCAPSQ